MLAMAHFLLYKYELATKSVLKTKSRQLKLAKELTLL